MGPVVSFFVFPSDCFVALKTGESCLCEGSLWGYHTDSIAVEKDDIYQGPKEAQLKVKREYKFAN